MFTLYLYYTRHVFIEYKCLFMGQTSKTMTVIYHLLGPIKIEPLLKNLTGLIYFLHDFYCVLFLEKVTRSVCSPLCADFCSNLSSYICLKQPPFSLSDFNPKIKTNTQQSTRPFAIQPSSHPASQ